MLLAYVLTTEGSGVRLRRDSHPATVGDADRCVRVLSDTSRHGRLPFRMAELGFGPSERTTPNHHCSQLQ
jgi:hypothetical protein